MKSIRCARDPMIVVATIVLLPACGAESADLPNSEEVADVGQALYEQACWEGWPQVPVAATADAAFQPPSGAGFVGAMSQNANYDHPQCDQQWIVDAPGVYNRSVWFMINPDSHTWLNQDWCPGFWSTFRIQGFRPTWCQSTNCGGTWEYIGEQDRVGEWWPNGNVCGLRTVLSYGTLSLPWNHGYTLIRAVAQAGWAYQTLLPVGVTAYYGP